MKENLVREKGIKLLISLFKQAKDDGQINFDEQRILEATDINVTKLVKYVEKAWDDNQLTEKEKQQIIFLTKKVNDDAELIAEMDNQITKSEKAMLEIICNAVEMMLKSRGTI